MTDTPIIIAIACNDSNGNLDRAGPIHMLGCEFETVSGKTLPFRMARPQRHANGWFTLAGKRFHVDGWIEYYGNMAWNCYYVSRPTAEAFLRWLHRRKLYDITTGPTEFFDSFQSDGLSEAAIAGLSI